MKNKKDLIRNIIWLFVIGCLVGYILEFIWYYIRHDRFMNVQGLLYGPFKPIYGLGVLIVSGLFYKLKDKNIFIILLIGTLFGALFEYSLSMFQEFVLHTKTWNYSNFDYNINGRIYIPYCFVWGLICLTWVKLIHSKIINIIKKIPYFISYIVGILIILDLIISGLAVYEYSNRQNNIKTNNKILLLMDEKYPDDVIKNKLGKVRAVKK